MVEKTLPIIEDVIKEMFLSSDSIETSLALWAALSSTVDKYAIASIKARGGDPDVLRGLIDKYFLENPL